MAHPNHEDLAMYPSLSRTATSDHPLRVNTTPGDTAGNAFAPLKPGLRLSNCETLSEALSNIGVREWLHPKSQRQLAIAGAGLDQRGAPAGSAASQRLRACMANYRHIAEQISALPPEQLPSKVGRHIKSSFDLCGKELTTVVACREMLDKLEANNAPAEDIRNACGRLEAASKQALRSIECVQGQLPVERATRYAALGNLILIALSIALTLVSIAFPPAAPVCWWLIIFGAATSIGMTGGALLTCLTSGPIHSQIRTWASEARIGLPVTEDRRTAPQWLRRLLT